MEQYKKSNRNERLDKKKSKSSNFFGSKKHVRIQSDKQNSNLNKIKTLK